MLGMFNSVKPYVVPKPKVDVPRPDNAVFRLHYKASMPRYFIKSFRSRQHFYNIFRTFMKRVWGQTFYL